MKNLIKYLALAFITIASTAFACNEAQSSTDSTATKHIVFEKMTVARAVQKAKEENKLVFIDAYTTWCGPCKRMSKFTFTDDQVARFFNTNFINLKVNMEKPEGMKLEKKFDVYNYPTLLFLDGDGKLVKKYIGYHTASQFLRVGKKMAKRG